VGTLFKILNARLVSFGADTTDRQFLDSHEQERSRSACSVIFPLSPFTASTTSSLYDYTAYQDLPIKIFYKS